MNRHKTIHGNQRLLALILCLALIISTLCGCDLQKMADPSQTEKTAEQKTGKNKENKTAEPESTPVQPAILVYYDADGNRFEMVIDDRVTKHNYNWDKLEHTTGSPKKVSGYDDGTYTIRQGVDVSHHNGVIDWEKVKKAGYDFAFLRLGYRGYGKEGRLLVDRQFQSSFKRARAAGIDLGVYFFSQAINEKEAIEEAKLVLRELNDSNLELPVVYDPEFIREDEARTDNVTKEQFTKNTLAFCKVIKKAGYQPAIYTNLYCQDHMFDLSQLEDYPLWYADYKPEPQTPYRFTYWQYAETGKVPGISGNADLNVEFVKKKKK